MQPQKTTSYRGRFAPTPSGPLHFGSLIAALGSYLESRIHHGEWLVRIEDIDPPRIVPGAADDILRTLDAFGFEWDGEVLFQSRRTPRYMSALQDLAEQGLLYPCTCSRKMLSENSKTGIDGLIYPGHCRHTTAKLTQGAIRLRVSDTRILFEDGWQGRIACNLLHEAGDFVIRRADGVYSYQLGVVVDDADQGITHVVRGADLLTSTPRQIMLQQYLHMDTPAYLHLPVVLDAHGDKLSKQTLAKAVDGRHALPALHAALDFLGVEHPESAGNLAEFWTMALECWPRRTPIPIRGKQYTRLSH